jgi:hypothetical protein
MHHLHLLVNYETTWYASNRAAYDEVQAGSLGELRRVVVHDGHQGPKEIGVPPEFLGWLTDPAQNGAGALYDFGCYGVDLMTWLMHGQAPLTVTAVLNHDKPQTYPKVDDDATVVLTYPHAQAVIMASWNWPFGRKDMEASPARRRGAANYRRSARPAPAGFAELSGCGFTRRVTSQRRPDCPRHERRSYADTGCCPRIGAHRQDSSIDEAGG